MQTLIIVVHVIAALAIVGLVLLQQGKGADAGASFGAGASQTVFGASGSGNFLVRATTISAVIFFVTSLSLAIFAKIKPVREPPLVCQLLIRKFWRKQLRAKQIFLPW